MEKELRAQLVDNFSKLMDKYKDREAWLATLPPAVQRRIAALRELPRQRALRAVQRRPGLKDSVGERPNHSNCRHQNSVEILPEFEKIC